MEFQRTSWSLNRFSSFSLKTFFGWLIQHFSFPTRLFWNASKKKYPRHEQYEILHRIENPTTEKSWQEIVLMFSSGQKL